MSTFQTSILHEIAHGKPISLRTRLLYRRRLQNRVQRLLRKAFRDEQKRTGLTQKEFAERIDKDKSKVNQWLSIASNLTLETISDLLLGLGVDLDELSVTRLANLIMQTANDIEEEEKASPPPPQLPQLNPPPAAQSASALESQQHWNPPLLGLGDDPAHQVTP